MKKVSLTVICKDDDAEGIAHEMMNSNIAQAGVFTWGTSIKECSESEIEEVRNQVPPDILSEYEGK